MVESGDLAEAERLLRKLHDDGQTTCRSQTLLGIALIHSKRIEEALIALREAENLDPGDLDAKFWLAMGLHQQGHNREAIQRLLTVVEGRKTSPEVHSLLGNCLLAEGRGPEAEAAFQAVTRLLPESPVGFANLGLALRIQNKNARALQAFKRALSLDPHHPGNFLQLAKHYQHLSLWHEAVETLEKGRKSHPSHPRIAESLAFSYSKLGRNDEAETLLREISTTGLEPALTFASWLQEQGRFEESTQILERIIKAQPLAGQAYRLLVEANRKEIDGIDLVSQVETLLQRTDLPPTPRMHLSYALGKLHERGKHYQAAMTAYDEANAMAYQTYARCRTFDPVSTAAEPSALSHRYPATFFERTSNLGSSDSRPIFIIGMIRSGTTLVDQILSSHPEIISAGEGEFWNAEADVLHNRWLHQPPDKPELHELSERYLNAMLISDSAGRFTDKMPLNYRHLGPILATFPNAKIIHVRRDPFDTCLSIWSTFFAGGPNFVHKKENIVCFYRAYLSIMDYWRSILPSDRFQEVEYEELIAEPEGNIRSLISFLDLEWNEACLNHAANTSNISTPSRWQARQPIYNSSLGKRKGFEPFAGAFKDL